MHKKTKRNNLTHTKKKTHKHFQRHKHTPNKTNRHMQREMLLRMEDLNKQLQQLNLPDKSPLEFVEQLKSHLIALQQVVMVLLFSLLFLLFLLLLLLFLLL